MDQFLVVLFIAVWGVCLLAIASRMQRYYRRRQSLRHYDRVEWHRMLQRFRELT